MDQSEPLNQILEHLIGSLQFWTRGLVPFFLVCIVIWVWSSRRRRSFSLRSLWRYMFPRELYGNSTSPVSYWHFLLAHIFWSPLITLFSLSIPFLKTEVWMQGLLVQQFGRRTEMLHSDWSIVTFQVCVYIISNSFFVYALHYAKHKIPFLWSFHRPHHSQEALTIPSAIRLHPIESFVLGAVPLVLTAVVVASTLYITGIEKMHPTALLILGTCIGWELLTGIFDHTHIPISFGWFDRIFQSPVLHQIHHSAEPHHRDTNFAGSFHLSFWDWMFGTLYLPRKGEQYRWGISPEERGPNNPHLTLRRFYVEPFQYAWKIVRNLRTQH